MWKRHEARFEVACLTDKGRRDYQEDTLLSEFRRDEDCGAVILADGMGGHQHGDVASGIVADHVLETLTAQNAIPFEDITTAAEIMANAIRSANQCIQKRTDEDPSARGMGTTLITSLFTRDQMLWSSVGDSPLLHYRDGGVLQVNEDHSMAPQINAMAAAGLLSHFEASNHPQRNCLISAIMGGRIQRIDNRAKPLSLRSGDIIVIASDGLQALSNKSIAHVIKGHENRDSEDIADALMAAVQEIDDPEQDNTTFAVVKVNEVRPITQALFAATKA